MRVFGGVNLRLTPSEKVVRSSFTPEKAESLSKLIRLQPYIKSCQFCTQAERDSRLSVGDGLNIDLFRKMPFDGRNIIFFQSTYLGLGQVDCSPWLSVESKRVEPVVIHRSPRYHNKLFPWSDVLRLYGGRVVMVGERSEHADFVSRYGWVPHYQTDSFLDLAMVIAGSELFVGNQSAPMAVALGLGSTIVQETWPVSSDCKIAGRNNQYVLDGQVEWPEIR